MKNDQAITERNDVVQDDFEDLKTPLDRRWESTSRYVQMMVDAGLNFEHCEIDGLVFCGKRSGLKCVDFCESPNCKLV